MVVRILPLVWRNMRRNRRRSVLTMLGVAVAIFVFAALTAAVNGIMFPVREAGSGRLLKTREAGRTVVLASRLPEAYERRIAEIPGVEAATGVLQVLAVIRPEMIHIFVHGVDPQRYRDIRRIRLDPRTWNVFCNERRSAVAGHRLMEKMGWHVGDEVEIAEIGLRTRIVGMIPSQGLDLENHMLVHRKYLQAVRDADGQITYVLVAPAPNRTPEQVAAAIDKEMETSPVPTQTASSAAYARAIVEDYMGFVGYLKLMGFITVLITVLGAGNAIAMNVRERVREIGVLKAIGFRPGLILFTVLAESTGLSLAGGILGIGLAALAVGNRASNLSGLMLDPATVAWAAVLSIATGMAGGLLPAVAAARLRTVDAIRGIE